MAKGDQSQNTYQGFFQPKNSMGGSVAQAGQANTQNSGMMRGASPSFSSSMNNNGANFQPPGQTSLGFSGSNTMPGMHGIGINPPAQMHNPEIGMAQSVPGSMGISGPQENYTGVAQSTSGSMPIAGGQANPSQDLIQQYLSGMMQPKPVMRTL